MNIHALAGTKVKYTGQGGYGPEKERADKHLTVGDTYTVAYTNVGNWHTNVHLREVPGVPFNSVMFDDIEQE